MDELLVELLKLNEQGPKNICFHHSDPDGWCSAAIVNKAYGVDVFVEIQYGSKVPLEIVGVNDRVWIVDFSFEPPVMEDLLKKTPNVVWIDHHKTALEYKYSRDIEGLREMTKSGCMLSWSYIYPRRDIPRAVQLVNDRDMAEWKLKETAAFDEYVREAGKDPASVVWTNLLSDDNGLASKTLEDALKIGAPKAEERSKYLVNYVKTHGFETEFEGYKVFAIPANEEWKNEAFIHQGLIDKYDMCISYIKKDGKYLVGLRSHGLDVSAIAKKYGGGGHTKASGFSVDELPFKVAR